jgi:antitoxin component YwqK of YwqJK toxin-antitoxin module
MRTIKGLVVLLAVLVSAGCGSKVVNENKLVERDGLKYEVNSEKPFTGTMVSDYPNGKKKQEREYRDGKLNGIVSNWYENGQKESVGEWKDGQPDGNTSTWYENGQKQVEFKMRAGKLHGESIAWYENGEKKSEIEMRDGNLQGAETTWYENGKKKSEVERRDGKKNGGETTWYENGKKESESEWRDGKLNGRMTTWYKNGQKFEECENLNGKPNGKSTIWYENGQKQIEGEAKDGQRHGKVTFWYENGKKKQEVEYREGVEVSRIEWDENGKKKTDAEFLDSKPAVTAAPQNGGLAGDDETAFASGDSGFSLGGRTNAPGSGEKRTGVIKPRPGENIFDYTARINKQFIPSVSDLRRAVGDMSEEDEYRDGKSEGKEVIRDENGNQINKRQETTGGEIPQQIMSRDAFRQAVIGKTREEVVRAIGMPSGKNDEGWIISWLYTGGRTQDIVTGIIDEAVILIFHNSIIDQGNNEKNHWIVNRVEFSPQRIRFIH